MIVPCVQVLVVIDSRLNEDYLLKRVLSAAPSAAAEKKIPHIFEAQPTDAPATVETEFI